METPELERLDPYDEEKMQKCLNEIIKKSGFEKLMEAEFRDACIFDKRTMTMEGIIEEYGHVLTPDELKYIKNLISPKNNSSENQ